MNVPARDLASSPSARHLVHVFPGFGVGGSQSRLLQLLTGAPQRYRHTILSLDGRTEMAAHLPPQCPVAIRHPGIGKGSGLQNWRQCRAVLKELRPDMLVTYNWGAMDWCISNRLAPLARHVHIEDGFGPEEKDRQLRRRVWTRRLVLGGGNSIVVVPSQSLERLARERWRIPGRSLRYIPNGVDCTRFGRRQRRDGGPLVVGTVATLRPEKNLARLIRLFAAFAGERDVRLVIVGDGPERQKLEGVAAQSGAGSRILFTGATATPERELEAFDIFALSSDTEQMPLSVLEAMASGLPVISFAVGDVPQMVAPGNRPYAAIPLADDAGFIAKLAVLADQETLRRQLGEANQDWARTHFDLNLMLERYLQLFG